MDLDQLRYFLRVVEVGNFTRAADQLHLSQPALSRSIQRLEEELGQQLLERKSRSLALTEAGERVQSRARQIVSLLDDLKTEIADDGRSGRLRIGAIPTVAPYFLPDLLRQFSGKFPEATLVVQEETTERLLKRLRDGDLDLAIAALPLKAKYLEVEEIAREELLLVLPPDHPLVAKRRVSLKDVAEHPFVLLDEAHCLADGITTFCRQNAFHPVTVERTSQLAMVQELVALAHGVSFIPSMAQRLDASPRRVYRRLSGSRPTRSLAMASNPYRFQSKLLAAFRAELRAYASAFPSA